MKLISIRDLDLLKSCIKRHSSGPSRVDTILIQNADHMYTGEESQVAKKSLSGLTG